MQHRITSSTLPLASASRQGAHGFTIVELLIVVVIIAILASVTVVAYSGISGRANDASVKSDLANIAKKLETYRVDNDKYPLATNAGLISAMNGYRINTSAYTTTTTRNLTYCTSTTGTPVYAIGALSKSGKSWLISSSSGSVQEYLPGYADGSVMTSAQWCDQVSAGTYNNNFQGYVSTDSPPWRVWTGV